MHKAIWSMENIKEGFERFMAEKGRLPTASEIDRLDYLPSSRQVQRRFGGLEKLRGILGYGETHFGKGEYRSLIATKANKQGRDAELLMEKILKDKFHEVFVHTEKIFDDSKNRVDFYIYCPDGNFGIDVFQTQTMRTFQSNVNSKIDKYTNFPNELYFVVDNDDIRQFEIDTYLSYKTKKVSANTHIVAMKTMIELIEKKSCYPDPLK